MVKLSMFMSSYVALFGILGVRWIGGNAALGYTCFGLAALGIGLTYLVIWSTRRKSPRRVQIATARDAGPEVAGYLATYLLPLVSVSEPAKTDVIAYAMFLLVSAIVFVRTNMIQTNPTLYLMGYRTFEVEYESGAGDELHGRPHVAYLVTRGPRPRPAAVLVRTLRDTVMMPDE